ncbi:MAG: winged helix DNA-binding domain-containing protein [Thermoleophilaceae bacterium]
MSSAGERLTTAALNRALLARQGLLERIEAPLVDAVEAIGALQAQHWPALPVALWSRVDGFSPADLHAALGRGELAVGTLLRGTLHLVSAREHPAYAEVAMKRGTHPWRRTMAEPTGEAESLPAEIAKFAREPRTDSEIAGFIEQWVEGHPGAIDPVEVEQQRKLRWRPLLRSSTLIRAPEAGEFGSRAPRALRAAPALEAETGERALETVVRRHLRAFGPAAAEDVAGWIGWSIGPVRAALERLGPELAEFRDESDRALHDLSAAPRPDPETPAPPRLLAAFDSVLLAYMPKHRARILPEAHRDAVYEGANLQIRPSFTVDGVVAGTWSIEVRRSQATLTLRALARIGGASERLEEEADRLARALAPAASAYAVRIERSA